MFFKLALRNVRRSIKDYLVYFLTIALAVCIFYAFNSIDAQLVMLELQEEDSPVSNSLVTVIGFLSVLIAFVLAFLIIYANGFMMRRRKQEFGIYMSLGASNRSIAGMLAGETLVIGVLALAAGIGLGYFASQGMSVATARLFHVEVSNYRFIFSVGSLAKTAVSFAVIFLVVTLLNVRSVSSNSLAQLLTAREQNQKMTARSRTGAVLLSAAGAAIIAFSYWFVFAAGIGALMSTLGPAVAVNFAGTLLFFLGLAGILLTGPRHSRRYYTGLHMFAQRQFASRVRTHTVTMSVITTLLFLTIVIVSTASSVNTLYREEERLAAPFDASFTLYLQDPEGGLAVEEALQDIGISEELFSETYVFPLHETDVTQGDIITAPEGYDEQTREQMSSVTLNALAVSDFNMLRALQGQPAIALDSGCFAVDSFASAAGAAVEERTRTAPPSIEVAGVELRYDTSLPVLETGVWTTQAAQDALMLILPDDVAAGITGPQLQIMVANYEGDVAVTDQLLRQKETAMYESSLEHDVVFRMALRTGVRDNLSLVSAVMLFSALYVGLVFLIAGAAILALQMLTGVTDDLPRYQLLGKLGAGRRMLDRAFFAQTAAYFFLPLGAAAVHSIFGISFIAQGFGTTGLGEVAGGAFAAAGLLAAVYGLYFLATWLVGRVVVRTSEARRL